MTPSIDPARMAAIAASVPKPTTDDRPDYLLADAQPQRRKSIRLHGVTWDVQWDEEHDDPEPYHYQFGTLHSAGSAYWVSGVLVNGLWLDREALSDDFARALDRALIDGMGVA